MMNNFVIVDIETTGLSRDYDRIIEIAAVRFDGKEICGERQTLINPEKRISSFITNFTGISQEMVTDAPLIQDVLPDFFRFLGDDVFVAHNASFDHGFISRNATKYLGHTRTNDILCTRKLANRIVSHLENKKLGTLCDHYGVINIQAHRAMADVLATTEVLKQFMCLFDEYHTDSSPASLLDIQKRSVGYGKTIFTQ